MSDDSYAKVRQDFEALKRKLKASVDDLVPEHYDQVVGGLLSYDAAVIRERIDRRRASHRVERAIADIEQRISAGEERERGRA